MDAGSPFPADFSRDVISLIGSTATARGQDTPGRRSPDRAEWRGFVCPAPAHGAHLLCFDQNRPAARHFAPLPLDAQASPPDSFLPALNNQFPLASLSHSRPPAPPG